MARTRPVIKVKLIVGMLSQDESLFGLAEESMRSLWGDVDLASEVMDFDFTDYYKKQMGTGLLRK